MLQSQTRPLMGHSAGPSSLQTQRTPSLGSCSRLVQRFIHHTTPHVAQGTHVESWQELLVDLHYVPVHAKDGHIWDTHVSHGVYSTLFGPFSKLDGQTPFGMCADLDTLQHAEGAPEYIKHIACTLISERVQAATNVPVRLHLTVRPSSIARCAYLILRRVTPLEPPTRHYTLLSFCVFSITSPSLRSPASLLLSFGTFIPSAALDSAYWTSSTCSRSPLTNTTVTLGESTAVKTPSALSHPSS